MGLAAPAERQRRRIAVVTALAVLPIVALGLFGWSAMRSAHRARQEQLRTSATFAGVLANAHIERELADYFESRQQKLLRSRGDGPGGFERAMHWVFLSTDLMDTPQFLSDAELREIIPAANPGAPGGHASAHAPGDPEPGQNAVLLVLRDHMARRARALMGFDPATDTFTEASVAKIGVSQELDGPHFEWLRIDVRDAAGLVCTRCERYVRKVGQAVGDGRYALLAVTFPLPGPPKDEAGLFGAVVPLAALREKVVMPAVAAPAHATNRAVRGGGTTGGSAATAGARPAAEPPRAPAPYELAQVGLGAKLRLLDVADPPSPTTDTGASSASATHQPPANSKLLYEAPLLGAHSPWRLQAVRAPGFTAGGWAGGWGGTALVFLVLCLLLLAVVVLLGRGNLRQMEVAQLRTHLVSNISHELKTPLSLIRLYAETLEHGRVADAGERQKFLEIITRESKRLTHLINNILDVDRIEGGRKRYSYAQVSPARVVRATVEAYRFQLVEDGFELRLDVDDGLPAMMLDEEAIAQALINLLDNAAKYSDTVKEIGVRLFRQSERVGLAVSDRGIGIAGGEHQRIFEPFYRVERGLVHDVKGSGLGLAVVRHVAQAHGGEVEVDSTPGRGSTFTLWLPTSFQPQAG